MTKEEREHYAEIARKAGLDNDLAIFDLETTGGDVSADQIVEVYIRRLKPDGSDDGVYHKWVKPDFEPKKAAVDKHGLTLEDLEDSPKFSEIAEEVADYLNGCDLAGFNIEPFDLPILVEEFTRNNKDDLFDPHNRRILDPYKMLLSVEKRDLFSVYKRFMGQEFENPHSAGADVEATIDVLGAMIDYFDDLPEGDVDELDRHTRGDMKKVDIAGKFVINPEGNIVFNFGKHRYVDVKTVFGQDPNYFDWIINRGDFHSHTRKVASMIRDQFQEAVEKQEREKHEKKGKKKESEKRG